MALDSACDRGHVTAMNRPPPIIDMTPDGAFRAAPGPAAPFATVPMAVKVGVVAAAVGVLGLAFTVAALALWVVSMILPVVVIAGAVAWGALKYRRWQLRRNPAAPPARTGGYGA